MTETMLSNQVQVFSRIPIDVNVRLLSYKECFEAQGSINHRMRGQNLLN